MELVEAIKTLQEELKKDKSEGSYYYSWKANIAMAFLDEYTVIMSERGHILTDTEFEFIKNTANEAAKNFLDLLISQNK